MQDDDNFRARVSRVSQRNNLSESNNNFKNNNG